jgi:hypothetical protein
MLNVVALFQVLYSGVSWDKHFSLLQKFLNYGRKSFIKFIPAVVIGSLPSLKDGVIVLDEVDVEVDRRVERRRLPPSTL